MAQHVGYKIEIILGLRYENRRRAVVFLVNAADKNVDAKESFDKLKKKRKDDLFNRFDYWLDEGVHDKYFHGWPNNIQYRYCFVFKLKDAGTYHRWYGFLINPRSITDRGYLVCVLVSHAQKNTEHTDPSELDGVNELRMNVEVIKAVMKNFPELERGK